MAGVLFFGAFAASCGIVGLAITAVQVLNRRGAVPVTGRIVGYRSRAASRGLGEVHSPIFEVTLPDGRTAALDGITATSHRDKPVGSPVALLYRPACPDEPLIERARWGVPIVFLCLALVLGLVAFSLT